MTDSIRCSRHHIRALLLMWVALLSASLYAQNSETHITLNIRNATLSQLVRQLENTTGFTFIYGEEVRLTRRITLEVRRQPISEILRQAFRNEPVEFEISDRHILLRPRPLPLPATDRRFTISGYVTDGQSAETLIGANVLEQYSSTGTTTNTFGFYTLTLSEGEADLCFSYLGYTRQQHRFTLKSDTVLNIRLNSNNQLAEVIVLSDQQGTGIENTAMGTHEIPMTQIRHTPAILGEADLLKTIQLMPGVQAGVEGFSGLYVRGGGSDQNLVMLDGLPVYNADHLLGIFSIFTPEAVKSVTLSKGSFPACYGGRLSSIVDVRTNNGDMHRYHGALSIGMLTDKLHLEGPILQGRTSFSLSARVVPTLFFKNLIKEKDDYYSDTYNYYFYDVNAKVNHKFNDRNRLFLGFYRGSDHFHYNSCSNGDNRQQWQDLQVQQTDDSRMSWGNTLAYVRWNRVIGNRLFGNATFSYNSYRMNINQYMDDAYLYQGSFRDRYLYSVGFRSGICDWSLRTDFDYTPTPRHRIKFGAEFIHHTFRPGISTSKVQDIREGELLADTVYHTNSNRTLCGQECSLYAEDNLDVTRHLGLNAGMRLSLFCTQGKSYFSAQPRLSARYAFERGFSVKAAYSCMAQYVHLLSSTPLAMPTDLWVPITRNIHPMYANQYSLGGYYTGKPGWEFSLEGYYKQMRHILEYQDGVSFLGNSTHWEDKVEMGDGRSYGLEFMVQKTAGKMTGWLAYTLSRTEHRFRSGNINRGDWFPYKYDRRHNLSLCLNHTFSKRIDIGASWIFHTGGCITVPERATVVVLPNGSVGVTGYVSRRNNYRLPVTHRLNLGVNFHKETKRGMRTWNISLYNAYNAMNPSIVYSEYRGGYSYCVPDGNGGYTEYKEEGKVVVKKQTILPCIPSVTYTYRF